MIGDATQYRFSAKAEKIAGLRLRPDDNGNDEWGQLRLGTRVDTALDDKGNLTLLMDYFDLDLERAGSARPPSLRPSIASTGATRSSRGGDVQVQYAHDLRVAGRDRGQGLLRHRLPAHDPRRRQPDVRRRPPARALDITPNLDVIYGAEYRYWTTHTDDPIGAHRLRPERRRLPSGRRIRPVPARPLRRSPQR